MKDYIGIDLGNINSTVSYIDENDECKILKIKNNTEIPSVICFDSKDKIYFGEEAKKRQKNNPETCITSLKKMLKNPKEIKKVSYRKRNKEQSNFNNKSYVIDTNVFVKYPQILQERIYENEKVFLPITVFEELGFRKNKLETKYAAEDAIKNINEYIEFDKYGNKIYFEESDTSLLPKDFFKKFNEKKINNVENDNRIISIALAKKKQGENVTVITSDGVMIEKLKHLKVDVQNLEDFKSEKDIKKDESIREIDAKEAITLFLKYIKKESSNLLKKDLNNVIVALPANFGDEEAKIIKDACKKIGFKKVETLKEAIAAAMSYGIKIKDDKYLLVCDFGGLSFNMSLVKKLKDENIKVVHEINNSNISGKFVTECIYKYICKKIETDHGLNMEDLEKSKLSIDKYEYNEKEILSKSEELKKLLSSKTEENLYLSKINISKENCIPVEYLIKRAEIEKEVLKDINENMMNSLNTFLKTHKVKVSDIEDVILTGKTFFIPLFQKSMVNKFGKKVKKENLKEAISFGTIIKANKIDEGKIYIDESLHDFGIKLYDYSFDKIIDSNTKLPVEASKVYKFNNYNKNEFILDIFARDKNSDSKKIYDDGISYIKSISIDNIDKNVDQKELTVKVELKIDREYNMRSSVKILRKNDEPLTHDTLLIIEARDLIKNVDGGRL